MAVPHSPPTQDEIASLEEGDWEGDWIVAVGGLRSDLSLFLRFAFRNGDTEIVCFDQCGMRHLVAVLKALVPSFEAIESPGVSVSVDDGAVSAQSP